MDAIAEPCETTDAPAAGADNWTAWVLVDQEDLRHQARQAAVGLGLAASYGVACGMRAGGVALASSAVLVPAAFVAASAFGLPALYIALAMVDAPLSPRRLAAVASRAIAAAGVVLAGLSPVAALYVVSSDSRGAASLAAQAGLAVGSLAGFRVLWIDLLGGSVLGRERERDRARLVAVGSLLAFGVFALAVALRVWRNLPLFHLELPR